MGVLTGPAASGSKKRSELREDAKLRGMELTLFPRGGYFMRAGRFARPKTIFKKSALRAIFPFEVVTFLDLGR